MKREKTPKATAFGVFLLATVNGFQGVDEVVNIVFGVKVADRCAKSAAFFGAAKTVGKRRAVKSFSQGDAVFIQF